MRYLKGSKSKSLVFRRRGKLTLECFSDADWAGNLDHRKSTSGYCRVYFMKSRDETLKKLQQFCADVGQRLILVSDGAKEYISNDFKKFARLKGIRLENSAAYTPQRNGKIEINTIRISEWVFEE